MKTAMTNDNFAEFIAKMIFNMDNYQFDILYDVRKIIEEFNKHRYVSDKLVEDTFHLMIRDTGCDLIKTDDRNYKLFEERSSKIYCLEFCWNRDYFNVPFCYVEKIK